jgi:hypothetical protein
MIIPLSRQQQLPMSLPQQQRPCTIPVQNQVKSRLGLGLFQLETNTLPNRHQGPLLT